MTDRPDAPAQPGAPAPDRPARVEKNGLEWTVFALSLALVALVVGTVARGAGVAHEGPPRLVVTLGAPEPAGPSVRVPVTLRHEGGQTVESATVEVARGAGEPVALTFGFTPRGTARTGAVEVEAPGDSLRARVAGYTLP